MISTSLDLANVVRIAREVGVVGIDTEFVWDKTYYPTLGLIQIGFPDGRCDLIDAPMIEDWSPLAELISDPYTIKVLHDAQQDLNILYRISGALPKNIFDTQRSSGFIGLSSSISLSELLKTLLKVRLAKTETRSNWLARPLNDLQLKYAEDDVRYSVDLMQEILIKADALDRKAWIKDEMEIYEEKSKYVEKDPDYEMPRVRGSGTLTFEQREILRALGAWRELNARRRNLPRCFVISDHAILTLSKLSPAKPEDIRTMKGLSEGMLNRNRRHIWEAIERARNGELPKLPNNKFNGLSPDEGYESRVDLSLACIKGMCLANKIDPALIGNRAEVTAFVLEINDTKSAHHRILHGWRSRFCGQALFRLLKGEGNVSVNPQTKLPKLN